MFDKLVLNALKEALDAEKYQELMKHLNLDKLYSTCQETAFKAGLNAVKYMNLGNFNYHNVYAVTCYDKEGNLKWEDTIENIVTDVGLVHSLDVVLSAGTQITAWYLGLYDSAPNPVFGSTMASIGGTEFTEYASGTRPALTIGAPAASAPGATLSATQVSFAINTNTVTCGGAFITDNATKGGTTGLLYGGAAFTGGDKALDDGDTLNVDVTINASSS